MANYFGLIPKSLISIFRRNFLKEMTSKNIVFITGCDSGLGFNLAILCHSLNMTVISGCLNKNSEGANILKNIRSPERIIPVEVNLENPKSIQEANRFVTKLLAEDNTKQFSALINNAGIMCFGEFEWQTPSIIEKQININLLGTMRITKEFLPLIRQQQARIINITSHCGLQALPGLSTYVASKAALRFWTDGLRMEMLKYGVDVVNFIPGSFVGVSNIASNQGSFADEMWENFTAEQKEFYGDYFKRYNSYLKILSGYKPPMEMKDEQLFVKFRHALLDYYPKAIYIHEPLRYSIYHILFRLAPTSIRDWLVKKFISMPEYKP